ncbi:MAG: response regulator transcription factor [Actinomycetota bacterium]
MRVLVVEDDLGLGDALVTGLRLERLAVDWATTAADAEELLLTTQYDVVCLDLGLPDGDGLDLCARMRSGRIVRPRRLLMITARDAVQDRVAGLDAGADDYLVKPFKLAELAARIRALLRRDDHGPTTIEVGDLVIDVLAHRVQRDGEPVELTNREFSVLRYLGARAGEVVSAEELMEHCWDANADDLSGSVKVILSRVRAKLGQPPIITTVRGAGYRLECS